MFEPMRYYDQCVLLLPFFGNNNGTVFNDYSKVPKKVTNVGNTKTSTSEFKYYDSSVYLDGTGDYLTCDSVADDVEGTSVVFTIEGWFYKVTDNPVQDGLFGFHGSTGATNRAVFTNYRFFGTTGATTSYSTACPLGEWFHFAAVRSLTHWRVYLNGVNVMDITATGSNDIIASDLFSIGQEYDSGPTASDFFNGYINDFIVTKIEKYTSNFTPPTRFIERSPDLTGYIAVSGGDNPYSITLSLTESLAATDFTALVTNANTGFIMSKTTVSGVAPTINLSTNDPCMVTLYPDYGTQWTASTAYVLNDKVFPTDPATSPYYYECTTAGTSDASEPTWPTSGTVNDNTVVWTYVEQMVQPITHGPLIPS